MSKQQKSLLPGDFVNKNLVNKNQVTLPKELSVSGWEMFGQDYDGASLRLILVIVALVIMIMVMMIMVMMTLVMSLVMTSMAMKSLVNLVMIISVMDCGFDHHQGNGES